MKRILSLLLLSSLTSFVYGQTFQGTIVQGSTANAVKIVVKPSGNISGQLSSFQFALAIPKSLAATAPAATITSLVTGLSFGSIQTSEENVSGVAHYVYTYGGVGDATVATVNYVAGTEYPIVEVSFADNPPLDQIKLVQLPGGGTTQNSNFYMALGGVEVENSTAQFYGSNAVNDGNGFDGTSFVTIGGTLPVKFISFYALKSGDAAKLTWTVNDDPENKYFDVERSLEGRDYKAFTRVNALANGAATNTYNTMDPVLSKQGSKTLYYRVKQVDRNGTTTYSLVRMLNVDNGTAISLYPNPARTTTKMIVDAPEAGQASVILRDGAGKQLQMINWQLVKGINQKDINVGSLPSGEYHVTLMGAGMNQTIKLSKVN